MKLFLCGIFFIGWSTLTVSHNHDKKNTNNIIKVREEEASQSQTNAVNAKFSMNSAKETCGKVQIKKTNDTPVMKNVVRDAQAGEFPWIVTLEFDRPFCGGSLLDSQYVLTAAHCVKLRGCHPSPCNMTAADLSRVTIRLGQNNLSSNSDDGPTFETRKIAYVITHQNSSIESLDNDIALIKLSKPMTFGKYIQPICLPNPTLNYEEMESDLTGSSILWDGEATPAALQTYSAKIWSKEKCKDSVGPLPITDEILCAGENLSGNIFTAHGEPLTVNSNGQTMLVGMSLFNNKLYDSRDTPFYIGINQYVNWINSNRQN